MNALHRLSAALLLVGCGGAPIVESTTIVVDAHTELTLEWSVAAVIEARGQSAPARELTREVSRVYARYVRAKRRLENARAVEERLSSLVPMVRAQVAGGMAPTADADSAEQALAAAHLATVAAQDDLRVASGELAVLLEQPGDAPLPPPADAGPAVVSVRDLAALRASANRPDAPLDTVARAIEEAHGRLLSLVGEWQRLSPPPDSTQRERARYEAGLAPLSELLDAIDADARALDARTDLAARIADASAELEHAVGVRLEREPLPLPSRPPER